MSDSKKACERKQRYTNKEAMKQRVLRNQHNFRRGTIYKCEHCNYWHLTKKPWRWPLTRSAK